MLFYGGAHGLLSEGFDETYKVILIKLFSRNKEIEIQCQLKIISPNNIMSILLQEKYSRKRKRLNISGG